MKQKIACWLIPLAILVAARAESLTVTYSYDDAGRVSSAAYQADGQSVSYQYNYDNANNLLGRMVDISLLCDIDSSGDITLSDCIEYLKILAGTSNLAQIPSHADINCDQRLGLHEALYILTEIAEVP